MYLLQPRQSDPQSAESNLNAHAKIAIGITIPIAVLLGALLLFIYHTERQRHVSRPKSFFNPRGRTCPKINSYLRRSLRASQMREASTSDGKQAAEVVMYELEGDYGRFEMQHMAAEKRKGVCGSSLPVDGLLVEEPGMSEATSAVIDVAEEDDKHQALSRAPTIPTKSSTRSNRSPSLQIIVGRPPPSKLPIALRPASTLALTVPESPAVSSISTRLSILGRSNSQLSAISPVLETSHRLSAVSPLCEGPFWNQRLSAISPKSDLPLEERWSVQEPWTRRLSAEDVVETKWDEVQPLKPKSRSEEDVSAPTSTFRPCSLPGMEIADVSKIAIPPAVLSLRSGRHLRQSMF